MTEANGKASTFAYDGTGSTRLRIRATDQLGRLTSYTYDNGNRLTSIRFPDATRSTYAYDGDGKRRTAQEQTATITTFVWDGDDYLGEY